MSTQVNITSLFNSAFCSPAHQAQQAGRAALRVDDECVVIVTSEIYPLCKVLKKRVLWTNACYVAIIGHKFHRSTGKATGQRKSARVSRTLYAITPEIEAWFKAKEEQGL